MRFVFILSLCVSYHLMILHYIHSAAPTFYLSTCYQVLHCLSLPKLTFTAGRVASYHIYATLTLKLEGSYSTFPSFHIAFTLFFFIDVQYIMSRVSNTNNWLFMAFTHSFLHSHTHTRAVDFSYNLLQVFLTRPDNLTYRAKNLASFFMIYSNVLKPT